MNRGASLGYKGIASPEFQEFEPLPERDPSAEKLTSDLNR
jgi:hypothetical protein